MSPPFLTLQHLTLLPPWSTSFGFQGTTLLVSAHLTGILFHSLLLVPFQLIIWVSRGSGEVLWALPSSPKQCYHAMVLNTLSMLMTLWPISTFRLVCVNLLSWDIVCLSDGYLKFNVSSETDSWSSCPILLLLQSSSSKWMAIRSSSWSG